MRFFKEILSTLVEYSRGSLIVYNHFALILALVQNTHIQFNSYEAVCEHLTNCINKLRRNHRGHDFHTIIVQFSLPSYIRLLNSL